MLSNYLVLIWRKDTDFYMMILNPSAFLKTFEKLLIMCQFQDCVETGLVTLQGGSHGMIDRKQSTLAHSQVTIWESFILEPPLI